MHTYMITCFYSSRGLDDGFTVVRYLVNRTIQDATRRARSTWPLASSITVEHDTAWV
jgi:hypothetical protein